MDSARQVFDAMKKAQPAKLYIACDAPAVDWFFGQEEMGIILEDDVRIWQISGFNMQNGKHRPNDHYFFSHFGFSWARRAGAERGPTSM